MKKINIRSLLVAAGDNSCSDAKSIVRVAEAMYQDDTFSVSLDWMNKIRNWSTLDSNIIKAYIKSAILSDSKWKGDIMALPKKYTDLFKKKDPKESIKCMVGDAPSTKVNKEVVVKVETSKQDNSKKKMNLRTLLHYCEKFNILSASDALDILNKMSASGEYDVLDNDISFAKGWLNFNPTAFESMVHKTYKGENGFAKWPIETCDDFETFIPLNKRPVEKGTSLNMRTVLNKFYESKCSDGVKIAATIRDLEQAGYSGLSSKEAFSFVGKTNNEILDITTAAHMGTSGFTNQDLLDNCPSF